MLGPRVAEKDGRIRPGLSYLDRHLVFPMLEFLSEKRVRSSLAKPDPSAAREGLVASLYNQSILLF